MNWRLLIALPLLSLLTACAGDKYPYPPRYVAPTEISPKALAVPPALGSAKSNQEIAGIIARQKAMSAAEKHIVMEENSVQPLMIVAPVLGTNYTEDSHPALFTLLKHSASDSWRISDAAQDYWGMTRPWIADKRVQLLVKPITRPSYPSGHTVTNSVWAHVLSELFPEKRAALFARASQIGQHRVDGGAHFPHDVEGGKIYAKLIFQKMREKPEFKSDLAAAKAELGKR